jgi:hypothetical protein
MLTTDSTGVSSCLYRSFPVDPGTYMGPGAIGQHNYKLQNGVFSLHSLYQRGHVFTVGKVTQSAIYTPSRGLCARKLTQWTVPLTVGI